MNFLKSNKGAVMTQIILVGGVLAVLAPYIIKSGLLKGTLSKEERQDQLIQETTDVVRGLLSNSTECQSFMNGGFVRIAGKYESGTVLSAPLNVTLETLSSTAFDPVTNDATVSLNFRKTIKTGSNSTAKSIVRRIPIKRFTPNTGGAASCLSYESQSVLDNSQSFCELMGGTFLTANSTCSFSSLNSTFKTSLLFEFGCQALGSNFVINGTNYDCDGVNINGDLDAPHFDGDSVDLGGSTRTDFQDATCSGVGVANQVNADSTINCQDVVCPQPSTSTYTPVYVDSENQIQCQCNRDSTVENPTLACGATDNTSCSDYVVNDGCGTGNVCQIVGGLSCNSNELCISRSCVCQPNCQGVPGGGSDGCGGTCAGTCTPSCSCASSTPVGQSCGDGCGGSCSGTSCSHLNGYTLIGAASTEEEWASGTQVCREQTYTQSGSSCAATSENDTEVGICQKLQAGTCDGTTAGVVENVADGTKCGEGLECSGGNCLIADLIEFENYYSTTQIDHIPVPVGSHGSTLTYAGHSYSKGSPYYPGETFKLARHSFDNSQAIYRCTWKKPITTWMNPGSSYCAPGWHKNHASIFLGYASKVKTTQFSERLSMCGNGKGDQPHDWVVTISSCPPGYPENNFLGYATK